MMANDDLNFKDNGPDTNFKTIKNVIKTSSNSRNSALKFEKSSDSLHNVDKGKPIVLQYNRPLKTNIQTINKKKDKSVLRPKRGTLCRKTHVNEDEGEHNTSSNRSNTKTRKKLTMNDTLPANGCRLKVLSPDEKRESTKNSYSINSSKAKKSNKANTSKKRPSEHRETFSSNVISKKFKRDELLANEQEISSSDTAEDEYHDSNAHKPREVILDKDKDLVLLLNDSQKTQKSLESENDFFDTNDRGQFGLGFDSDKVYLLRTIDKAISILKKNCDVSFKYDCLQKLCEKLSFAMAYAGLGTPILGKPEIRKLSAALIKVIGSYSLMESRKTRKTIKECSSVKSESESFEIDKEKAFQLAVLACNGLSLIIEDLSDEIQIIMRNGAVKAFVKVLNGKDRDKFAEHIVGLVFKLSMEYPSYLTSKELRTGIIKNIEYLDVHMQSSVMIFFSNTIGVLLSKKKKQVDSESKASNRYPKDLYDLVQTVMNYLFSPDKKVVENTSCVLSMATELIIMSNGSLDTLFDNRILKRLIELLNASVNFSNNQNSVPSFTTNKTLQTNPPYLGTLNDQALTSVVKILLFKIRTSKNVAVDLVKELGFLEVARKFFVNIDNKNLNIEQIIEIKTHVMHMLMGSKTSTFAFDLLHILSSLIHFQPTSDHILNIFNSNLTYPNTEVLLGCEPEDVEICNLLVLEDGLIYSFAELLHSSYNFYIMYESMNILTKILWCSSKTSLVESLLTNMENIEKITRPCFDIGIGYYCKDPINYFTSDKMHQYTQNYVENPHFIHARTLFEQCLNFEHLLIVRYGPLALRVLSRNCTRLYLEKAIKSFKKYFGSIKYSLRSRRKLNNVAISDTDTTVFGDIGLKLLNNTIKTNVLNCASKKSNLKISKKICENTPTKIIHGTFTDGHTRYSIITAPEISLESQKMLKDYKEKLLKNYHNYLGIDLDDSSSDDFNRITFELCENLKSQILNFEYIPLEIYSPEVIETDNASCKFIATNKSYSFSIDLVDIAKIIVEKKQGLLAATEFIESGLLNCLLFYLGDLNDENRINYFLHVFTGTKYYHINETKLTLEQKSHYVEKSRDSLITLLNNVITLLKLFPNFGSDKISNFSIPLRSNECLQSYTENAPVQLKKSFFWLNMPNPSEYYSRQLEKRLKVKITLDKDDNLDDFNKLLNETRYSLHFLSDSRNFGNHLEQKIKSSDFFLPNEERPKLSKYKESDTKRIRFIRKEDASEYGIDNSEIDSELKNILYGDDDKDYNDEIIETNDKNTDEDNYSIEFVDFPIKGRMYKDYEHLEYVPNDNRLLFGISDLESPNTPVLLDLTDTVYSSILDPNAPISKGSYGLEKFSMQLVKKLMGNLTYSLSKELHPKPKYMFRTKPKIENINSLNSSMFSLNYLGEDKDFLSRTSLSDIDVKCFINETQLSPFDTMTKFVYSNYLSHVDVPPQTIYDKFFEIKAKINNTSSVNSTNDKDTYNEMLEDTISSLEECQMFPVYPKAVHRMLEILKLLYDSRSLWPEYNNNPDYYDRHLFINTNFASRVFRQLEEPITAFSKVIPEQCSNLFKRYMFLFPYELRRLYFEIMTFNSPNVTRLWKECALSGLKLVDDESRFANKIRRMGHITRLKVKITRLNIIETAMRIFFDYANVDSELTIEYQNEVGAGLGPTLEFYSNLCTEVQKFCYSDKNSNAMFPLWRNINIDDENDLIQTNSSLFPAPIPQLWKRGSRLEKEYAKKLYKTLSVFALLGCFIAKSIIDSRLIDLPLSRYFIEMIFLETSTISRSRLESIELIKRFDLNFCNSLKLINEFVKIKSRIINSEIPPDSKRKMLSQIKVNDLSVEELYLDFTYPGYSCFDLIPNGSNIDVTIDNVDKYLDLIIDYTLGTGINKQLYAFKTGFNSVIPINNMKYFYPVEIIELIADERKSLSYEDVISSIKTDHGYTIYSPTIINFAKTISSFSQVQLRMFMQFITGSNRLPKNGLKGLFPRLTVVKRSDNCNEPDKHLPSVMTCVNYLKLPDYSSIDVLKSRLLYSITEGQNSFHLS